MSETISTLYVNDAHVVVDAPAGRITVRRGPTVHRELVLTIDDDQIAIRGSLFNEFSFSIDSDVAACINVITLVDGATLDFVGGNIPDDDLLFDRDGTINISLQGGSTITNIPAYFGMRLIISSLANVSPGGRDCRITFQPNSSQAVLDLSMCHDARIQNVPRASTLVRQAIRWAPFEMPISRRRRVELGELIVVHELSPVLDSLFSVLQQSMEQRDLGDADVPDPAARLSNILERWKERVATLHAIKGFLRHDDTSAEEFIARQHPALVQRLGTAYVDPARAATQEMRTLYTSLVEPLPPVDVVQTTDDRENQCCICQELPASFAVCGQCTSSKACEYCLTRQVMVVNDKCCLCNTTQMLRPAKRLD